jgi:hypothetical protein
MNKVGEKSSLLQQPKLDKVTDRGKKLKSLIEKRQSILGGWPDSISGYAKWGGLGVLRGTEMSIYLIGGSVCMLGYLFDAPTCFSDKVYSKIERSSTGLFGVLSGWPISACQELLSFIPLGLLTYFLGSNIGEVASDLGQTIKQDDFKRLKEVQRKIDEDSKLIADLSDDDRRMLLMEYPHCFLDVFDKLSGEACCRFLKDAINFDVFKVVNLPKIGDSDERQLMYSNILVENFGDSLVQRDDLPGYLESVRKISPERAARLLVLACLNSNAMITDASDELTSYLRKHVDMCYQAYAEFKKLTRWGGGIDPGRLGGIPSAVYLTCSTP